MTDTSTVENTPTDQQVVDVTPPLPPNKIAFVINGSVVDVLHTDDRLAAILLSDPVIIDATGADGQSIANVGDAYDETTGSFMKSEMSPEEVANAAAAMAQSTQA